MSTRPDKSGKDKEYRKLKWQLTTLSGALTTGLIIVLES